MKVFSWIFSLFKFSKHQISVKFTINLIYNVYLRWFVKCKYLTCLMEEIAQNSTTLIGWLIKRCRNFSISWIRWFFRNVTWFCWSPPSQTLIAQRYDIASVHLSNNPCKRHHFIWISVRIAHGFSLSCILHNSAWLSSALFTNSHKLYRHSLATRLFLTTFSI